MKKLSYLLLVVNLFTVRLVAAPAPLGNPDAPKGGVFNIGLASYPKALLYYLATDEVSAAINSLILEPLIDTDPDTSSPIPLVAESWTVSPDKKVFTFKLNKAAKFSDGKPVTSKDVKFTWDTLMNPKNKTVPFQALYASFEGCKVIDDHTIEFRAKTLHFKNLEKFTSLLVMPEHFFSKGDFNKAFANKLLGSGPYTVETVETGKKISVKRNPDYWGKTLYQNIGRYNFDRIVFKSVPDYNVQFEMFKRGDIDYFYFLIAKMWATETDGAPFQKKYIIKLKGENLLPYATQGIAWNLRKPLFKDVKVRLALAHLFNREKMIKDLFYNNYVMGSGVVGVNSEYHSPNNKPVPYDPKKAKELLKEAGWSTTGSDGILVKDGVRFEFELLTDNPSSHRYLTVYQEDLKQMGIKLNIRTQDWGSKLKLTSEFEFDATDMARSRDVHPSDFAVEWGSAQADIKGSSNIIGYKNPEIDSLAQKIDETFDKAARIPLVRKLDETISRDQPMAFAWEPTFFRIAYWNRFSFPGKGYFSYSNWRDAFQYWWFDKDKDEKLKKAMKAGEPLL